MIQKFQFTEIVRKIFGQLCRRKIAYRTNASVMSQPDSFIPESELPIFDPLKDFTLVFNGRNGPLRRPTKTFSELGKDQKDKSCGKPTHNRPALVTLSCMESGAVIGLHIPEKGETVKTNAELMCCYMAGNVELSITDNNCNESWLDDAAEPLACDEEAKRIDPAHFVGGQMNVGAKKIKHKGGHQCCPLNVAKGREPHYSVNINSALQEQIHAQVRHFDWNCTHMKYASKFLGACSQISGDEPTEMEGIHRE